MNNKFSEYHFHEIVVIIKYGSTFIKYGSTYIYIYIIVGIDMKKNGNRILRISKHTL